MEAANRRASKPKDLPKAKEKTDRTRRAQAQLIQKNLFCW